MKALLNTKNGQNDTVVHLLEIAERMGHLDKLVNAAYTDPYYEGNKYCCFFNCVYLYAFYTRIFLTFLCYPHHIGSPGNTSNGTNKLQ